jgi:hypothetical protein
MLLDTPSKWFSITITFLTYLVSGTTVGPVQQPVLSRGWSKETLECHLPLLRGSTIVAAVDALQLRCRWRVRGAFQNESNGRIKARLGPTASLLR